MHSIIDSGITSASRLREGACSTAVPRTRIQVGSVFR